MATTNTTIVLLIAALLTRTSAQAPALALEPGAQTPAPVPEPGAKTWLSMTLAPGPSTFGLECFNTVIKMSDCQTYVTTGSKKKKPGKECCPALAGLAESDPLCLCYLLQDKNITLSPGINVDMSRALRLPSACGVSTPPLRLCFGIDGFRPLGGDDMNDGVSFGVGIYALCLYSVVVFLSTYFMI